MTVMKHARKRQSSHLNYKIAVSNIKRSSLFYLTMINKFATHDDTVVEGVHDAFDGIYGRGVGLRRECFNL